MKSRSLTGIKPTGACHLGNFLGAIAPALQLSQDYEAWYFVADAHALNSIKDGSKVRDLSLDVAATWLACGLDPKNTTLYLESDVPEIFRLSTILNSYTAKGMLNRAHAYKSKVASNLESGKDPDHDVNAGLYSYPVLMAADILAFGPDVVPVGQDQSQHLEMCVDIAQSFNFHCKEDVLKLPKVLIQEQVQTIVGLDGRKMSKSYDNVIDLFAPSKKMRKLINKITTNSQEVEEPKDPDQCHVFSIFKNFATTEEVAALRKRYLDGGMGWGEAKMALFEAVERRISPLRERYVDLKNDLSQVESVLKEGGEKAREESSRIMKPVKQAIGLACW